MAAPLYNWTGCYLGGNVGGGWTRVDTMRVLQDPAIPAAANYGREDDSGFIGGGQAGCDFQTGNVVFGVQGTFDFGSIKGSHALTDFPTFSETNNLKAVYSATGRIGYLWTPSFLGYVKTGMGAGCKTRIKCCSRAALCSSPPSYSLPGMTVGVGGRVDVYAKLVGVRRIQLYVDRRHVGTAFQPRLRVWSRLARS